MKSYPAGIAGPQTCEVKPAKLRPIKADSELAEQVRVKLLHRLERHLNCADVRLRLTREMDVSGPAYLQVVQFVVARLFPECDDMDHEAHERGEKVRGLVPRGGLERVGASQLASFAATL